MNDVYWKSIGANPPARTVLIVAACPAAKNPAQRYRRGRQHEATGHYRLRDGRMAAAPTPPASWWTMFCMSRPRTALIP